MFEISERHIDRILDELEDWLCCAEAILNRDPPERDQRPFIVTAYDEARRRTQRLRIFLNDGNVEKVQFAEFYPSFQHPEREANIPAINAIDILDRLWQRFAKPAVDFFQEPMPENRFDAGDETYFKLLSNHFRNGLYCRRELASTLAALQGKNVDTNGDALVAGADYASVKWYGQPYQFTPNQAKCVQVLHDAFKGGTPELRQATILEEAEISQERLRDVFRKKGVVHSAWGTLIIKGKTKGSYRLNLDSQ